MLFILQDIGNCKGGEQTHTTGVAAPLLFPPPIPPPAIVEVGTGTVDAVKRDILVDGSVIIEVDDGIGGNGVTLLPPGDDGTTTTGGGVGITIGLTLTLVVDREIPPPPGSEVDAPPLTGKPAASTQI